MRRGIALVGFMGAGKSIPLQFDKVLQVFADQKAGSSIESTLVKFKGMEKDGMDVKIILRAQLARQFSGIDPKDLDKKVDEKFATLSPAAKQQLVKEHYLGLIRDSLRKQGLKDKAIDDLLSKPFKDLAKGSAEANQVIDAVLRAESAANREASPRGPRRS